MTTVKVFAPAKINLTLHVTGQRDDGYHLLDSLVAFAWIGDRLTFEKSSSNSLAVTGPFAKDVPDSHDNIIFRAADLLGLNASITLEKNLPVASGIGGGSSDAAATLKGLSKLYNKALPDAEAILELGADVPVCMAGGLTRMRGIGDDLTVIDTERMAWPMVLVNPGVQVSTPQVFARLSTKENSPMEDPFSLGPAVAQDDAFPSWIARQRNDLEAPAIEIAPVISDVLHVLRQQNGCQVARMSGSGATCFALFDHEEAARQATQSVCAQQPGWWVALSDQPSF